MAKLALQNITSGYASATSQNANNDLIETALENTLSRDGTTPNTMNADLDMNGHSIINAAGISVTGDNSFTGDNIHAATSKTTPVDADEIPISDSAATWGLKKLTWANLKSVFLSSLGTGIGTFLTTPSSANLRAALTDEEGTGAAYFVGGALGTPASGNLSNCTGMSPTTTRGDLIRRGASADEALAIGTDKTVLVSNGTDPAWESVTTLATKQATTSGTSKDFTTIPAGVKHVAVMFDGVSLAGADDILVQLGNSGGLKTSGYLGGSAVSSVGGELFTAGFGITSSAIDASSVLHGTIDIRLMDASTNTWVATINVGRSNLAANNVIGSGSVSLSGTLDRLRVLTAASTAFDAGNVNISYSI